MYILDKPIYFHLLWLLVLFVGLFWFWHAWRRKTKAQIVDQNLSEHLLQETSTLKHVYKQILFLVIFSLATLAMVNPKAGTKTKKIKRKGIDVVFLLDISKSMDAQDMAPSRLEKGKNMINKILDNLDMDRAGLIVYAGSAYPLVPMTSDYGAFKNFLANVDSDLLTSQGTALNAAFRTASRFLGTDTLGSKNKVIALLSDGEDHESFDLDRTLAMLNKTKIVTIGLGTEDGAPIPINKKGTAKRYKKDRQGHVVITKMNSAQLKKIGDETKGMFIASDDSKEVATYFKEYISKVEKSDSESTQLTDFEYQYAPILLIALILLILDTFILTRKTQWLNLKK